MGDLGLTGQQGDNVAVAQQMDRRLQAGDAAAYDDHLFPQLGLLQEHVVAGGVEGPALIVHQALDAAGSTGLAPKATIIAS